MGSNNPSLAAERGTRFLVLRHARHKKGGPDVSEPPITVAQCADGR